MEGWKRRMRNVKRKQLTNEGWWKEASKDGSRKERGRRNERVDEKGNEEENIGGKE